MRAGCERVVCVCVYALHWQRQPRVVIDTYGGECICGGCADCNVSGIIMMFAAVRLRCGFGLNGGGWGCSGPVVRIGVHDVCEWHSFEGEREIFGMCMFRLLATFAGCGLESTAEEAFRFRIE